MLVNLPQQSKDLLQANGFSVSRSDTPASRTAVDMTIEQTMNKHAKTSDGIVGFMANIESKNCETHKESFLSERRLSEKAVKKAMDTFSAFLNPFDTEREHLVCICSGQKVPEDVADDPLKVEDVGKKSFKEFVDTRLKDKTTRFHRPLTKTKPKTFGSVSKSTPKKSAKNVLKIKAGRNVFGQLLACHKNIK
ncbi:hypothetical protein PoB_003262200 [Plakobranchus ocellatus]|uniref:Uncharacterized protein n=1 Tax=Plakobranchus ocellatus TaxID=259542 RepID=A0AAV4AGT9_9GAST|nr:hypothetical protein PoB_003262200 [Plakobranchus ocellatus]